MKLINEKNFDGKTFAIPTDGKIFTGGETVTLKRIPEAAVKGIQKKATTYKSGRAGRTGELDSEKFDVLAMELVKCAVVGWSGYCDSDGKDMDCTPPNVDAVLKQIGKHILANGDRFDLWLFETASTVSNFVDGDDEKN